MAKKTKGLEQNEAARGVPYPNSDASAIFNKLFGEIPQNESSNSLFSAHNPFKRKTSNLGLDSAGTSDQNPKTVDPENPHDVEPKKRKINTGKRGDLEAHLEREGSGDVLVGKKSKTVKVKAANFDAEKGNGENPVVRMQLDGENDTLGLDSNEKVVENGGGEMSDKKGERKKKRKRDELEREYEARRYGVVAEEEGEGEEQGQEEEGNKKEKLVGEKRKTVENPAQMTISKDGYDDESKLLRTIFIGNLPLKVKKKVLLREFGQFGEIESVRIRSVPTLDSKEPKKVKVIHNKINEAADSVHAYIVFKTEDAVEASLAHNMAVFGGNHIRIDRACPPRKKLKGDSSPLYDNKRTVFVGNLPFDVKDEELYQLFCGISRLESSIEAIRVIRDPQTSLGKGIAYVLFKTREAANLVVKRKNLKLRDRELRISHAKSNSTPTKRRYSSLGWKENAPSKRPVEGSRTSDSGIKGKTKAAASYQGLRASKSGAEKKGHPKSFMAVFSNTGSRSGDGMKQRKQKRPAVAARKANAKALQSVGGSNHTGKKRKMESMNPYSSHQKKSKKLKVK
ncbi:hypothetical protein Ancab_015755 [Ancistrocladus abbreviatus]